MDVRQAAPDCGSLEQLLQQQTLKPTTDLMSECFSLFLCILSCCNKYISQFNLILTHPLGGIAVCQQIY